MRGLFSLTKPRMTLSNVTVAVASYIYASQWAIDWTVFTLLILGLGAVVASGCVFNNYFDRYIDARMERTKNRALASGKIPIMHALVLGTILLLVGIVFLWSTTLYSLFAALAGWFVYVCLYTPLKHHHPSSLIVGAIAGAMPPVVGYTAAIPQIDAVAVVLFLILFVWQIPHFVAIAIYRFDEYRAAGVPLLIKTPPTDVQKKLARTIFFDSLIILLALCVLLVLAPLLSS